VGILFITELFQPNEVPKKEVLSGVAGHGAPHLSSLPKAVILTALKSATRKLEHLTASLPGIVIAMTRDVLTSRPCLNLTHMRFDGLLRSFRPGPHLQRKTRSRDGSGFFNIVMDEPLCAYFSSAL
jgi:hypothetical protein